MSTVAITLVKLLGPTLARAILTVVLKDNVTGSDMAEQLTDSLNIPGLLSKVTNEIEAEDGAYFFNKAGREAAQALNVVFETEGAEIAEAERDLIAQAVSKTMEQHALDLLVKNNLQQTPFLGALQQLPKPKGLNAMDYPLYERVLEASGKIIFDSAAELPHFSRDTTSQILQGMGTLLDEWRRFLTEYEQRYKESHRGNVDAADADFEEDYRKLLVRHLDKLEFFGVPQIRNYAPPLSIAYITLKLLSQDREQSQMEKGFARGTREQDPLPAPEALAKTNRALIIGSAGSGKTTLLKWLTVRAANSDFEEPLSDWNGLVPFYVRLRDFATEPLPTGMQLLTAFKPLRVLEGMASDQWVHTQLKAGRGIFLLDGLDEIGEQKRQDVVEWLDTLHTLYPRVRYVVSTRPTTLKDEQAKMQYEQLGFKQLVLQALSEENAGRLVTQWHEAMSADRCELRQSEKDELPELEEKLQLYWRDSKNGLKELMSNPLLCAMVCALHQVRRSQLPRDRVQLYGACVEMLLEGRDAAREVDLADYPELSLREKEGLLAKLAYWLMRNKQSVIEHTQAVQMLAVRQYDGEAVLGYLLDRTSLLQIVTADSYDFVHRTFQEYLAAKEIYNLQDVGFLINRADDPEWRNTVLLFAAVAESKAVQMMLLNGLEEKAAEDHDVAVLLYEAWQMMVLPKPETLAIVQTGVNAHIKEGSMIVGYQPKVNWGAYHKDQLVDTAVFIFKPLQSLNLNNTSVADLAPLAQLSRLQWLDLEKTSVADLAPLAQLSRLQVLILENTPVADLAPLANLPQLQVLILNNTGVADLAPLANLPKLQWLNLKNTPVADLAPLANLPKLQLLNLKNTPVADLAPLANLPKLQLLNLNNSAVMDLAPLAQLPQLQVLYLINTDVADLAPLADLPQLQVLSLSNTGVSNLAPLAQLPQLQLLNLINTDVADLAPLALLSQLQWLNLNNTSVADLAPLADLTQLQWLDLEKTSVADLAPLAQLAQLQALDLRQLQIERWFDPDGTDALAAIWVDDPAQVPANIQARVQINPTLPPFEFMQSLNKNTE